MIKALTSSPPDGIYNYPFIPPFDGITLLKAPGITGDKQKNILECRVAIRKIFCKQAGLEATFRQQAAGQAMPLLTIQKKS